MKPFNLEAALAGEPFGRKHDLRPPDDWHYFTKTKGSKLFCIFDTECGFYEDNGGWISGNGQSNFDLVMLPKRKKLWVAVSSDGMAEHHDHSIHRCSNAYSSEQDCREIYKRNPYMLFIEVEIDL